MKMIFAHAPGAVDRQRKLSRADRAGNDRILTRKNNRTFDQL